MERDFKVNFELRKRELITPKRNLDQEQGKMPHSQSQHKYGSSHQQRAHSRAA